MRKAAITFLLLFSALNLICSQEDNRKTIFAANAGCSVPYAEFAAKSMGTSYAGFASPGMNIGIDLLRYSRFLGFSSGIGYSSLFFNEKAYKSGYDRILTGWGQNSVSAGNYQVLTGLLGLILKIPQTGHIEALMDCRIGVAMSIHPNLTVINSKLGEINSVTRNGDWNLAAEMGLRVHYWLTEKYGITFNFSLNSTRPDFYDDTGTYKTFALPVMYMNINAGFVMKL